MRLALLFLALHLAAHAADVRNTSTPNTDTPASFTAPADTKTWESRRAALKSQILSAAGLVPMPAKTPLNPLVFGRLQRDGYTVEKVALETRPGYWLGGNLFRPAAAGKHPAVLQPHGHWNYGRLESQPLNSPATLAANLARRGFVVFNYDMAGYTDTAQTPHDFSNRVFQLWSFTPLGLQLWNSIRALDFIASLAGVDPTRIAITGASGGGTQTFLLAAVDSRIALSAPVNMVSGLMQGGCICENAPGLRIGANNIEIAATFAPKPMLLVAATGDWTKNVPKVEFPAIRAAYDLYGKPEMVEAVQFDSPHNYHQESREAVYEFLRKHFTPETAPFKERGDGIEKLQDTLVWDRKPLPAHARTFEQIFDEWKAEARRQVLAATPADLKQRLRLALSVQWPQTPASLGGPVPQRFIEGKSPVLYLHPDGIDAALNSAAVKALQAAGRGVLLIDAFQTGTAKAPRDRSHRHFLTFNPSDDQARVQDVLSALRWLHDRGNALEIQAEGDARWWALFAAAAAPVPVRFSAPPATFDVTDEKLAATFFVPGLQRAGGAAAALRTISMQNR
ncbi:MAG: acetylxylan esterase [Candidatus Solibacter usitatus]|nr:acetylxylan esterase [Candidatus Solibacter usitatus]